MKRDSTSILKYNYLHNFYIKKIKIFYFYRLTLNPESEFFQAQGPVWRGLHLCYLSWVVKLLGEFLTDASQEELVGLELSSDVAMVVDHSKPDVLAETRKVEGEWIPDQFGHFDKNESEKISLS